LATDAGAANAGATAEAGTAHRRHQKDQRARD
jgi:hypothetical protein